MLDHPVCSPDWPRWRLSIETRRALGIRMAPTARRRLCGRIGTLYPSAPRGMALSDQALVHAWAVVHAGVDGHDHCPRWNTACAFARRVVDHDASASLAQIDDPRRMYPLTRLSLSAKSIPRAERERSRSAGACAGAERLGQGQPCGPWRHRLRPLPRRREDRETRFRRLLR